MNEYSKTIRVQGADRFNTNSSEGMCQMYGCIYQQFIHTRAKKITKIFQIMCVTVAYFIVFITLTKGPLRGRREGVRGYAATGLGVVVGARGI